MFWTKLNLPCEEVMRSKTDGEDSPLYSLRIYTPFGHLGAKSIKSCSTWRLCEEIRKLPDVEVYLGEFMRGLRLLMHCRKRKLQWVGPKYKVGRA